MVAHLATHHNLTVRAVPQEVGPVSHAAYPLFPCGAASTSTGAMWHDLQAQKPQCRLPSVPERLFGRERHMQAVHEGLEEKGCVALYGGPGDGKTALAMTVGRALYEEGKAEGGAYVFDLAGTWRSPDGLVPVG